MPYDTAKAAGAAWKADHQPMLLSFPEVRSEMLAFCTTEAANDFTGADEDTIYMLLNIAFTKLYLRGAITPIRPFSSEGERQLREILANFNVVASEPDVDQEEVEHLSLREQAVRDSNTLPSVQFNQKLRADPKYRAAYEAAGGFVPDKKNL